MRLRVMPILKEVPVFAISNPELESLPVVRVGEKILCPSCGKRHKLVGDDGGGTMLLFYRCKGKAYLGAICGRCTVHYRKLGKEPA